MAPPSQGQLGLDPQGQILSRIAPGQRTERYGRTWIIGRTEHRDDGSLFGRIGYQAGGTVELWDEDQQDFIDVAVQGGFATPFLINVRTSALAFQPRPPQIKIGAVTGAFKALLSTADEEPWSIYSAARRVSLDEWLDRVIKVTHVRMRMRRPNPHYEDTPNLEALLEQSEADVVRLEARSKDGLKIESGFIQETLRHVGAGYGDARLTGTVREESGERETVYDTEIGTEEQTSEAPANPDSGEVSTESLQQALAVPDDEGDTD